MIEGLKIFRCGDCGDSHFKLYGKKESEGIFVECEKCKSVSVIEPSKPKLEINFGENSTGRIAIF